MDAQKIVVGVDGSAIAAHALAWAMDEAEVRGAAVVAVHAYHYPWAPSPVGYLPAATAIDDLEVEARERVGVAIDEVMAEGGWTEKPESVVRFGPRAVTELCDESKGATMLVVGQRGGGGFLGLRLGSVSEGCLHRASTTLVIVPEASAELGPLSRITVGVDASVQSRAALRWGRDQGERYGVPVVALMAWSWLGPPYGELQPLGGWDEDEADAFLEGVLIAEGCETVQREVRLGSPVPALVERSEAGDLVVVGADGVSAVRGVLAGSVSRQLAHHAVAPIVVVRST